jgi:hypothetical protein
MIKKVVIAALVILVGLVMIYQSTSTHRVIKELKSDNFILTNIIDGNSRKVYELSSADSDMIKHELANNNFRRTSNTSIDTDLENNWQYRLDSFVDNEGSITTGTVLHVLHDSIIFKGKTYLLSKPERVNRMLDRIVLSHND